MTERGSRYAHAALDETRSHLAELFAGRFTVHERMPWNGLALVYRSSTPDATVALAVLPLDCENESTHRDLFERGMHRVREVAHPVFVEIAEVGIQQGVPFVAYEHSTRPTLLEVVATETFAPELTLRVARRLLSALNVAPRRGDLPRRPDAIEYSVFVRR